ncbi:MAG: hypothetical protein N2512_10695 [Armatimonadetes bacterium]|nr:hypothetical protein [Armatimonadota bacterium]
MVRNLLLSGREWRVCGLLPREWEWKSVWQRPFDAYPAYWIPAEVPGSVQLDLLEAGVIPDWTRDLNSRACEWTSYRDWVYVREFPTPAMAGDETAWLRVGGVDWTGHVFLNGEKLGVAEGMWTPREWNVTGLLRSNGDNMLVIVVEHAPQQEGQIGYTDAVRIWKPRFAYDWDWCVRLIPLGIFGDVELCVRRGAWVDDLWVRPQVAADLRSAQIVATVSINSAAAGEIQVAVELRFEEEIIGHTATAEILRPGSTVVRMEMPVKEPVLWRPNDGTMERQPLYSCRARLLDGRDALDERTETVGFRRIEFERTRHASEDALPYQPIVNGQKVFIHGSNWAPLHQLYGRRWKERYERQVDLARRANINLLRVWGGGLLEREEFYDACDRAGIMVWQEFLQSSSGITNYPAVTREYLDYVSKQAPALIRARRNHPSLVIWTGGNELIGADNKPLDDNYPVLHLLREIVKVEDPDRLYLATSPTGPICGPDPAFRGHAGDVHGHWRFLGDGNHQEFYANCQYMLHSEFGTEGAANIETLRAVISPDLLWPPDHTNPIWVHHGEWWINRREVEDLFGSLTDMESFVQASQWLHCEGLRWILEEDRRKAPSCAGTMNWQYNEPFPNTSCTNVLDYFCEPKPVYFAMRDAYAPAIVTARAMRLGWAEQEAFEAEIWASVDVPPADGCEVAGNWNISDLGGSVLARGQFAGRVEEPGSAPLGHVHWTFPQGFQGLFFLELSAQLTGCPSPLSNLYTFSNWPAPAFACVWTMGKTTLSVTAEGKSIQDEEWTLAVHNVGKVWAVGVRLRTEKPGLLTWSDAYLTLPPQSTRRVRVRGDFNSPLKIIAEAFNAPAAELLLR